MSEIEIFISYAPEDEALKQELEKHLAILRHKNLITVWHNRNISAGTEWEKTIHTHLDSSRIILLLISSDFLASHYCYGVEMKYAMEKHRRGEVRVIPVILRSVDWHIDPLSALQALPTDAKPVTLWSDRDAAFRNIETGIRRAVEELSQKSSVKAPKSATRSKALPLLPMHLSEWSLDLKQWIALLIGIVICGYATYTTPYLGNLFFLSFDRTANYLIAFVVYGITGLFLGAKYGPLVGFFAIGFGSLSGFVLFVLTTSTNASLYLSDWVLFYVFYRSYLGFAIAAFIAGLAFFKTQGQYGYQRSIFFATGIGCGGILLAEATTYIGDVIIEPPSAFLRISPDHLLEETIAQLLLCLFLLPLTLMIYHRITRKI